jgi:hypothetical protein
LHATLAEIPLYRITLLSSAPKNIRNKLNSEFPQEYSIDLVSRSHIIVLKCSGRSVFIRDVSAALTSDKFSDAEKAELHGFGWISLLNLNIDKQWRLLVRQHMMFWIENFKNTRGLAWSIPIVSARIYNWIMRHNLISKTSDKKFNRTLGESLVRQLNFLKRQLYLPMKASDKISLVLAVATGASAVNDDKTALRALRELTRFLADVDVAESCKTPLEILNVLRNLVDIQALAVFHKIAVAEEISRAVLKLAHIIRKIRHSDGGISIFLSEFTPIPSHIDAVLSGIRHEAAFEDNSYLRLQSFEGTAFIDLRNKYFPLEFSSGPRRLILGTYACFSDRRTVFSGSSLIRHSVNREKNNIWFNGKSEFVVNDHEMVFEKKLYINNLGTDIRCEESVSAKSFDVLHYIVLPGEINISPLEYKNGFFMDLKNGIRWLWNFNKGAEFSFDFEKNGILNGEKTGLTLLAVNAGSSNKLRWSLKKV